MSEVRCDDCRKYVPEGDSFLADRNYRQCRDCNPGGFAAFEERYQREERARETGKLVLQGGATKAFCPICNAEVPAKVRSYRFCAEVMCCSAGHVILHQRSAESYVGPVRDREQVDWDKNE